MHPTIAKTRLAPTRIAPETFLIHDHHGEGTAPVSVPLNTMVIRGREPVVVDTGVPDNREQYLADVFSIVEPADIRWIYISHDDIDHTGNVNALVEAAPNATLVINWFMVERMGSSLEVPPARWRWVGDGETFDVGDRRLYAVRPPVFDSPTTRGLFDPTTGVYWSSDCFATPMLNPVPDVSTLDDSFWAEGMAMFHQYVSPWLAMVDDAKYHAAVDRVASLPITAMAGCHTPAIPRHLVGRALELVQTCHRMEVPPEPDQSVLEEIQRALEVPVAN